jgi:phenylacetic acid degradation operon negative regulatory protein
MADDDELTGRSQQPRALIVTVYGLYAREVGGWMSVASVIKLLAECGVDAPAVRSAIFRLKRRGLLDPTKVDGIAGYALSERGYQILLEGDRRIFERHPATLDEGWVLAVFSVPETERDKRHQLRSRLARLGFGTAASGIWIAPSHLYDQTRDALERSGQSAYVDLFQGQYRAFDDIADQVGRWWDLGRLQDLYQDFLDRYEPVRRRYRRGGDIEPSRAFVDYVRALTDWRRLPYSDPGLPAEVLPKGWSGAKAATTFFDLRERLAKPAHEFVESILRPTESPQ